MTINQRNGKMLERLKVIGEKVFVKTMEFVEKQFKL